MTTKNNSIKAMEKINQVQEKSTSIIEVSGKITEENQIIDNKSEVSHQTNVHTLNGNIIIHSGVKLVKEERTLNRINNMNESSSHPLHRFPRGPMVPIEKVPRELILAYAELIEYQDALQVIADIRKYRLEADDDEHVTLIKVADLPPHSAVAPIHFWTRVFHLSCLHGPRMLGAVLLVVSDEQFKPKVREIRENLIRYLETMWNT